MLTWKVSRMASHLFSRPSSAKFILRNRLRRVLLESLERRELMAADLMGFSDLGAPVSYTLAGQASQPLAFQTTGDLSGMSPDEVTSYLDTALVRQVAISPRELGSHSSRKAIRSGANKTAWRFLIPAA